MTMKNIECIGGPLDDDFCPLYDWYKSGDMFQSYKGQKDCDHTAHLHVFKGIYCYDCGKFLEKDPKDIEYPETQETHETWHDRPPLL